jgi:predicted metal-dependent phosphoesterase TrpH
MFEILKPIFYKKYEGHVSKYISLENASRLSKILGGKLILAHPYKYPYYHGESLVNDILKEKKLDGIECIHSNNKKEEIERLLKYCDDNNLYVGVGSDYHYDYRMYKQYKRVSSIGYLDVLHIDIATFLSENMEIKKR